MKYDELEKLAHLKEIGALTEEEFQREKEKILNDSATSGFGSFSGEKPLFGFQENHYCAAIHFSQFLSYIIPVFGIVVPIILWIVGKKDSSKADIAGRNCFDWMLSALIYLLICIPLVYIIIGVPLAFAVAVCAIVFPIIAGVKAFEGETWRYPLSIHFFTESPSTPQSSRKKERNYDSKPDKDAHFSKRKYN